MPTAWKMALSIPRFDYRNIKKWINYISKFEFKTNK